MPHMFRRSCLLVTSLQVLWHHFWMATCFYVTHTRLIAHCVFLKIPDMADRRQTQPVISLHVLQSLWIERTTLILSRPLPGISRWAEVERREVVRAPTFIWLTDEWHMRHCFFFSSPFTPYHPRMNNALLHYLHLLTFMIWVNICSVFIFRWRLALLRMPYMWSRIRPRNWELWSASTNTDSIMATSTHSACAWMAS